MLALLHAWKFSPLSQLIPSRLLFSYSRSSSLSSFWKFSRVAYFESSPPLLQLLLPLLVSFTSHRFLLLRHFPPRISFSSFVSFFKPTSVLIHLYYPPPPTSSFRPFLPWPPPPALRLHFPLPTLSLSLVSLSWGSRPLSPWYVRDIQGRHAYARIEMKCQSNEMPSRTPVLGRPPAA